MKRYIILIVSVIIIALVPITLFDVIGFRYELGNVEADQIVSTTYDLIGAYVPATGTEAHDIYRKALINRLESYGYDVEIQEFKQLGPMTNGPSYLEIGDKKINLIPVRGGRSIGADFTGHVVIQNLTNTYEEDYVKDRFVISTGTGELIDVNIVKLYEAGCKGIIVANGFYGDGNTELDYTKLDGKTMPILYVDEENRDWLFELASKSEIDRRTVSYNTSSIGVEFFDAGAIEDVHIVSEKTVEILKGYNIIARAGQQEETVYFGTHYDGPGHYDDQSTFYNTSSVAMMLELAEHIGKNSQHLKKNSMFVFFDGGLLDQAGAKHFKEAYLDDSMQGIYLDRLGMNHDMMIASENGSQFLREKLTQFDLNKTLALGHEELINTERWNSPGVEAIRDEDNAVLITSDFQYNSVPYFMGQKPLVAENLTAIVDVLDRFIKYELFEDRYPDYMKPNEWFMIVLICVLFILMVLIHQMKHHLKIKTLYYSVPYTIFRGIMNAMFIVITTLGIILCITILPGYFNVVGGMSNYGFYTLWYHVITIIRSFFTSGLGMSSTGVPYIEIIFEHGKRTFLLLSLGLFIAIVLGIFIGMFSSYLNKGSKKQQSLLIIFGLSIPETVLIIGLLLLMKPIMSIPWIESLIEAGDLRTVIMPLFVLALVPTIYVSRTVYMTLVEEVEKKYIISLKAKGVKKDRIYTHHLLKVALNKVMNHMPMILAINIATMIICERLFSLTGIFNTIINTLSKGEYLFYLGIVLSIMAYYYIVVISSQVISKLLMPRSGGAYEVE